MALDEKKQAGVFHAKKILEKYILLRYLKKS